MTLYALGGVSPTLGKNVFVAPSASVMGDVVLGDEASVWFGAVLRGDQYPIRVGARTNIQDNAVLHITGGFAPTHVGDDVTVGHLALVHGCTVGNRCLVGMGAIILDGAVVEDECLIAAGALVAPRTRIPSRSLVMGRPGKVVRTLTDGDLEHIRAAAAVYVANARDFMGSLRALP
ncbi:MAG: carbonic anhydrase, family 3 [Labilithrix sp.]|nr:carbonic anhydrase, family 3 [Labilithrix sp.]